MDKKPEMTWTKLFFIFLLLCAFATAILIFGPMSSRYADKKYRQSVDRNGTLIKAIITNKREFKGRVLDFGYYYKDQGYSNNEDSKFYYELTIGDSILIKIDSLHPGNSYIVDKLY